jgi:hypothetical protein
LNTFTNVSISKATALRHASFTLTDIIFYCTVLPAFEEEITRARMRDRNVSSQEINCPSALTEHHAMKAHWGR